MFGLEQFKLWSFLAERDTSLINVCTNNEIKPIILKEIVS
jgi:hypothetical protein